MKPMDMGVREEFLLKRVAAMLIILKILPERIATSSINPYLKRDTIFRQWIILIPISMIVAS